MDLPVDTARRSALSDHIGSLAIAAAIVIAACVYGFVASPAFATFLLYFIGFALLAGFAASAGDGALGSLITFFLGLSAIYVIVTGIEKSLAMLQVAG